MASYSNAFGLSGPGFGDSFMLLLSGALLGIFGAALAVSKHLHSIEPK